MASGAAGRQPHWAPTGALLLNAAVWGLSWWPFRQLNDAGVHPLWATAIVYSTITVCISLLRPAVWPALCRPSSLWVLVVAAGTTNAGFNWAVSTGDVVRVVLLFYLMPLWAVLLARWLLKEAITLGALARVALGLAGALLVLWPTDGRPPWQAELSLADGLSILGGFSFALNNVMLRREQHRAESERAAAMFVGGAVVAAAVAGLGGLPAPTAAAWPAAALGLLGLTVAFMVANSALQFGASRLPAHRTAVIMLTEVLFASVSAVALGAGVLSWPLVLGGALIVGSALLAALE